MSICRSNRSICADVFWCKGISLDSDTRHQGRSLTELRKPCNCQLVNLKAQKEHGTLLVGFDFFLVSWRGRRIYARPFKWGASHEDKGWVELPPNEYSPCDFQRKDWLEFYLIRRFNGTISL